MAKLYVAYKVKVVRAIPFEKLAGVSGARLKKMSQGGLIIEAFSLLATFTLPATCHTFGPCIAHLMVSILVLYEGDMGINDLAMDTTGTEVAGKVKVAGKEKASSSEITAGWSDGLFFCIGLMGKKSLRGTPENSEKSLRGSLKS